MIYRCNPKKTVKCYELYRKNNIRVCDDWSGENGFMNFYNWSMQNGYSDDLTIDRIDGKKGYCPENCRWVDYKVQANNTTRNRIITYNGQSKTMSEWAEELNIPYGRLSSRINVHKMSIEDAFRTDVMNNHSRGNYKHKKTKAFGEEKYLYEWAKENGLNPSTITERMGKGMSIEDSIKTKKNQKLPQSVLENMFKDYYSGMPESEISKKYGISNASICRYRQRYGKPVRDKKISYENRRKKHGY